MLVNSHNSFMRILFTSLLLTLAACSSTSDEPKKYNLNPGECIEEPFGVYTYKVISVENNIINAKPIGAMGKSMVKFDLNRQQLMRVSCP